MGKSAKDILGKFCFVEGGGVPSNGSVEDVMYLESLAHSCSTAGEGGADDMCRLGRAENKGNLELNDFGP